MMLELQSVTQSADLCSRTVCAQRVEKQVPSCAWLHDTHGNIVVGATLLVLLRGRSFVHRWHPGTRGDVFCDDSREPPHHPSYNYRR